jgi:tetratricopeptide (TPR) repeat protein
MLAALLPLISGCAGLWSRHAPPAAEQPLERVQTLLEAGEAAAALAAYRDYLASRPPSAENRLLLVRLLIQAGEPEEARSELDLLLDRWPRTVEAYLVLAGLERDAGDAGGQQAALDQALRLDPENLEALCARGELAAQVGDTTAADFFGRALDLAPAHAPALRGLGALRLEQGRFPEAVELLDRALAAEPEEPFAFVDRARARAGLGDLPGALADLDEAIRLEPGHPWTYVDRGRVYLRLRRQEAAHADFSRAIALDPENFLAYALRAGLNDEREHREEARADYEKALALNPQYFFAFAPLATLYYIEGNWPQAAQLFRAAYEREPEEPGYALMAALSLRQAAGQSAAVRYLEGVLSGFPRECWCYETARFLMDPAREAQAVARATEERNRLDQGRLLFYVGVALLPERPRTALAYLATTAQLERRDLLERRIAGVLLQRHGYPGE